MSELPFIPVLLGSDINVYGMARSFHEEYGVNSIAVSKTVYTATVDSRIISFTFEGDLENPEKFLKKLISVADEHKGKKLVLVPCSDGYVELVERFSKELIEHGYLFNCPSSEIMQLLSRKESFYALCDKCGFDYPKTTVVTKEDYPMKELGFDFPVIVKASNSVEYWKCEFKGKKKVFIAADVMEYIRILDAVYSSGYNDSMTIQEYIPGDDSNMRVLNCYVGKDKRVKLMALGNPLLEEHSPDAIGNYVAIINTFDEALLNKFKEFLEGIGYNGFANFDLKYDNRDGKYKFFETNIRQGRSSFFVTAAGYNLAKWLVDDLVYEADIPLTIAKNEHLWLQVPKGIVFKYCQNEKLKEKARELIRAKKCTNSLFYSKDLSPSRYLKLKASMLRHYKKYKMYFNQKGMPLEEN